MSSATDGAIYLGALACELGQSRPIEELIERGDSKEVLDTLRLLGLATYLRSDDRSGAELMEASLRKTFASSPIAPEDIDFVFIASEHFDPGAEPAAEPVRKFRRELFEAVARVGATRAFPVGVTFAACGNFMSAVQLARCLTIAGAATNVLIAVVDRYPPNVTRVVPRVAIMSDAAATCIVSSKPLPGGFQIDSFAQHATLKVNDVDMFTNFAAYTIEAARAMRKLGADFKKVSPGGFDSFKWLVTNNYTLSAIRGVLRQLGCDDKKAFVENVAKTSHCNAADIPINLVSMLEGKVLSPGDRVLGFGNGASAWALAGFSYVPPT